MSWVFAYGSLMGDALLGRYPARPARLAGYHREFAHESVRRWGSREAPCPILGLAAGGECWGVAYAVPDEDEPLVARNLARREAAQERRRVTQTLETAGGELRAWVFVSRSAPSSLDPDALVARLRAAHGVVGNGAEYVRTVAHALDQHGLRDPLVEGVWARLAG